MWTPQIPSGPTYQTMYTRMWKLQWQGRLHIDVRRRRRHGTAFRERPGVKIRALEISA